MSTRHEGSRSRDNSAACKPSIPRQLDIEHRHVHSVPHRRGDGLLPGIHTGHHLEVVLEHG